MQSSSSQLIETILADSQYTSSTEGVVTVTIPLYPVDLTDYTFQVIGHRFIQFLKHRGLIGTPEIHIEEACDRDCLKVLYTYGPGYEQEVFECGFRPDADYFELEDFKLGLYQKFLMYHLARRADDCQWYKGIPVYYLNFDSFARARGGEYTYIQPFCFDNASDFMRSVDTASPYQLCSSRVVGNRELFRELSNRGVRIQFQKTCLVISQDGDILIDPLTRESFGQFGDIQDFDKTKPAAVLQKELVLTRGYVDSSSDDEDKVFACADSLYRRQAGIPRYDSYKQAGSYGEELHAGFLLGVDEEEGHRQIEIAVVYRRLLKAILVSVLGICEETEIKVTPTPLCREQIHLRLSHVLQIDNTVMIGTTDVQPVTPYQVTELVDWIVSLYIGPSQFAGCKSFPIKGISYHRKKRSSEASGQPSHFQAEYVIEQMVDTLSQFEVKYAKYSATLPSPQSIVETLGQPVDDPIKAMIVFLIGSGCYDLKGKRNLTLDFLDFISDRQKFLEAKFNFDVDLYGNPKIKRSASIPKSPQSSSSDLSESDIREALLD